MNPRRHTPSAGRIAALLAAITICVMPAAQAHHSIAGVYDMSQRVTVEGAVTAFHFISPHPFVAFEVKDSSGNAQSWTAEMDNRSELSYAGMTGETLKVGDRIVVIGGPDRTRARSLYISRLERPADGFWYEQVGSSPKISGGR